MGRRLTDEEKRNIEIYAREHVDCFQGRAVSVTVRDDIDDDGRVHFFTQYVRETIMPKGWMPFGRLASED